MNQLIRAALVGSSFALLSTIQIVNAETCGDAGILCVPQEYSTIQAAADVATAGQKVLVSDGTYNGFQIDRSGLPGAPITYKAVGSGAIIARPVVGKSIRCSRDGICIRGSGTLQGVRDIVIDGFKIQDVYRCISTNDSSPLVNSATEWPHQRITIRNNECRRSAHEGFYLSELNGSIVESNIIHDTGLNGATKGHCMYLANAASDNTSIRKNNFYNCGRAGGSAGIHFNGDLSVGGDGYQTGLLVENNIIHDTYQNGLNMDGVGDSTIQGNLIYNVSRHGIIDYAIDAAYGPKNMRIINNTLIAYLINRPPALKLTEDRGGHIIFNNIRIQDGTHPGDPTSVYDLVETYTKGSVWFVNPKMGDFHLKQDSKPVDFGRTSLFGAFAPKVDLEGNSRTQGDANDLGALEFPIGVAPLPTPTPGAGTTNQSPVVNLQVTPSSGVVPVYVNFSTNATDPDQDRISFDYEFGDGTVLAWGGTNQAHRYQRAGTYTACVVVKDVRGANTRSCTTLRMYEP